MSQKIVEIEISPEGDIQVKTEGYTGTACLNDTSAFEEAMGMTQDRIMTPESMKHDENERLNIIRN